MKKVILYTILALSFFTFAVAHSQIVISEIMRSPGDPVSQKSDGQWFEIYNNSDSPIDLRGWTIEGISSHIIYDPVSNPREEPFYIQPGEFFVFVTSTDMSKNGGLKADYENPIDLKKGIIKIYEPGNSTPVDEVTGFKSWGYDFFGYELMNGLSFVLKDLSDDNNLQKNWTVATIREGRYNPDGEDKGSPGVLGSIAFLQTPKIEWDSLYGGDSHEFLSAMVVTNDGGCIMGGFSESGISGDKTEANRGESDYWVVKTDKNGTVEWDKTLGGDEVDELKSIAQTSDGGFILGGDAISGISGEKTGAKRGEREDFWIVKLDVKGNIQWDKTIGGDGNDFFESVNITSDGGYILGGNSFSNISGEKTESSRGGIDFWIVKLDSNGNIEWDKTLGGNEVDDLNSIIQTSDGSYIAVGKSGSAISGDKTEATKGYYDFWVVKLNANGKIVWDKTYGGDWNETIKTILETKDGGFILGGDVTDNNEDKGSIWVVKTDNEGNVEWEETYDNDDLNFLGSIQETDNGGYIIGGENGHSFGAFSSLWIIKIDGRGEILWEKTISTFRNQYLASIQVTEDGGYLIGSKTNIEYSDFDEPINFEFWLIKLSPDPTIIPTNIFRFPDASDLQFRMYPNPASYILNLLVTQDLAEPISVNILNGIGQRVISQTIYPNNSLIAIDLSKLKSGIYFCKVTAGEKYCATKKLIIQK